MFPELLTLGDKSIWVIRFTGGNVISASINQKPELDVNPK